jgi:flagellin
MRGIIHDTAASKAPHATEEIPMSSILTNTSALVALQTLKGTNVGLAKAQNEISTGMKVATAKDNSSSWAIAATMKSDVASFAKLSDALTSASAMVGVARDAAEQITDILKKIQEKVVQAQNPDADTAKLDADITALAETITSIAESAQFNGINFVGSSGADEDVAVAIQRASGGGLTVEVMTITAVDLSALGGAITSASTPDDVETDLQTAIDAAAAFGAAQIRIEAQNDFLRKQADALKVGVGALVDADMEEASARLQALQVQQQLGIQALSIANQSPQNVLALFR